MQRQTIMESLTDSSEDSTLNLVNDNISTTLINELEDLIDENDSEEERYLLGEELTGSYIEEKIMEIKEVLSSYPVDFEHLRELAISKGGFIKDELRKQAWPHLMQVQLKLDPKPCTEFIKSHKYYKQVELDVNRSLKRFPPGIEEADRYVLMDQLTSIIIRVLENHPQLHYYQGYHDVAITFLLVMGETAGFELVEELSLTHLKDFMQPTMETTSYYLTYLYPVLRYANEELYNYLVKSGVGTIFCLPWLITWYAHTISDYRNVVRLYDFFLATPYLMPMYIAVAIVLFKENDILSGDCDMASQHFILTQVPDCLPFEFLLRKASELYSLCPPEHVKDEVDEFIKQRKKEEEDEKRRLIRIKERRLAKSKKISLYSNNILSGKYFYAASFFLGVSILAGIVVYYKDYYHFKSFFNS